MYRIQGKKINPDAQLTLVEDPDKLYAWVLATDPEAEGVVQISPGAFRNPELREQYGVEELPDPERGDDRYYFVTEEEDGSVSNTLKPLEMLKPLVLAQINGKCEELMGAIKAGYPETEVSTWGKQENEAHAHLAGFDQATPLLTALAEARGLDITDLANRIVAKADAFAAVCGSIIGTRQRLENELDQLPGDATLEELLAVKWPDPPAETE